MMLPPDFGLPTQIFADLPLAAVLERLEPLTSLIEIDSYGYHTVLSPRNRRIAASSGSCFTVHGPYGPDILPGSPDEYLRRAAVATHRRHLEASAEIGAKLYVVHPDYVEPPGPPDAAVVAALQRTIADLEEAQRQTGVAVAVENMPGVGGSHFVSPGDLDLGELGLALDAGHAAISGTLDAFLREPCARLAHVHLHDNRGPTDGGDPHDALGRGVVDVEAVITAARAATALVILEHHDEAAALASIAYLEATGLGQSG
jgi:sugar phosphate isomerase/epimerase